MRVKLGVLVGLLVATMGLLPLQAAAAGHPRPAVSDPVIEAAEASAEYDLEVGPVGATDEAESPLDALVFDGTVGPKTLTNSVGTAKGKARVSYDASVTNAEIAIHAGSELTGSANTADTDLGIAASAGQAYVEVQFVIASMSHYGLEFVPSATTSDTDDCVEASVSLAGTDIVEARTFQRGTCDPPDPAVPTSDGLLSPGTYVLRVDASGVVASAGGNEHFGTTFTASLSVFQPCTIVGTPDADPDLDGTPGDDVICGGGGADTISAEDGKDLVFGGPGNDLIRGGGGNDAIYGEDGQDRLFGDADDDIILGGGDADRICGGDGSDGLLLGEEGNDIIAGGGADDGLLGLDGNDTLYGGDFTEPGFRCISSGADLGDDFYGGDGDDLIHGGAGGDVIRGGAGSDKLLGEGGNDTIVGGTRKDVLDGGPGNDRLNSKDGVLDVVHGGPGGDDRVRADPVDHIDGVEDTF